MDPISLKKFMVASGSGGINLPAIGDAFQGGYYVGLISHTADGNATHALIMCPYANAYGYAYTGTNLKLAGTTNSTGAGSVYDGAPNTAALVSNNAGNGGAIDLVDALSIGGYTDWYVPSIAELFITYYNLKPTNTGNYSTGNHSYYVPSRTGAFTNDANGNPLDPQRTSLTDFRMPNGSQGLSNTGSQYNALHWSSTNWGNSRLRLLESNNARQRDTGATYNRSATRAFRKVAL